METGNQENIDDYLRKYEYTAKNLKSIFIHKISRNYKKKQMNK